jgi:hypothetical protein
MAFNSRDNKAMLWQLLSEHPVQKENPKKFQSILEYTVDEIYKNRFQFNNDLLSMNKELLKQFAQKLSSPLKKRKLTKQQVFEKKLNEQQEHFTSYINKPTQKEIDFSDKTEEKPLAGIDSTMQQRELELKKIMDEYNTGDKVPEWLQGESTSTEKKLAIDQSSNVKIEPTILQEVKTPVKTLQKRVTFEVSDSAKAQSFLNRLKKAPDDTLNIILREIKEIKENQKKILDILKAN